MFAKKQKAAQGELWVAAHQLPQSPKSTFYSRLDETLESFGFAEKVRALCAPAYKSTKAGRPGIDPVVYLKMIMIGFFEDLPSERAIAARCADSMSIRSFLNYSLEERTPDHSTFTIIRQRLGLEIYQEIFTLTLQALREHGLLRGKNLGIDSSVIEANASLRALVHRNTEEQYWDYVKRLAAENGIDPDDTAAVRKFDRHRPGKGSNQEWRNPHDPDAKIGRTKDGATDMIYKPEAVVDLDPGVIVQASVHPGDQADHQEMAARILEAQQTINQASGEKADTLTVTSVTSDKGYYLVGELQALQQEGIRTVISDPINNRRVDKLEPEEQRAVRAAKRSVKSKSGKDLLGRRGMHIERAFAHILDAGGMRRTTLRGWENLNKRFKLAAAFYNLSPLMRKLFGFGTPKQLAALGRDLFALIAFILTLASVTARRIASGGLYLRHVLADFFPLVVANEARKKPGQFNRLLASHNHQSVDAFALRKLEELLRGERTSRNWSVARNGGIGKNSTPPYPRCPTENLWPEMNYLKTEAILTQTVEQLERMNEALGALRRELLPGQPKKFAILAESLLELGVSDVNRIQVDTLK